MRNTHGILIVMFMVFVMLVQPCCNKKTESNPAENKKEETIVPVEYAQVETGDIGAFYSGTATMEAVEETEVVARVGGVVKTIMVEEGDNVNEGKILARQDDEKISVQVAQALVNLQKLETQFHRSEELHAKNLISTESYQRAKYEYEHQKTVYSLVKLDLEYTAIRAPISGVISQRSIKAGNMVLPNQATFRITALDPLLAVLHVPEHQMNMLKPGQVARVTIDAIGDKTFTGQIERISPVVNALTGTMKVSIEVGNTTQVLKPGMFARVNVIYDTHTSTMLLPKNAVITEDREQSVFVIRDNVAYRQPVKTGYTNSSHVEILEGVQDGDMVVTTGKEGLKNETKVELLTRESGEPVTQ